MAEHIASDSGSGDPPQPEQQQQLIESFRGVTSSSPAEAIFFLESHAWRIDAAVQSFFDAAADDDDDDGSAPRHALPPAASDDAVPPRRRRRRRRLQEEDEDEEGDGDDEDDEDYAPPPTDERPQPRPATRLTAATMASSSEEFMSSRRSRASGGRPAGGVHTLADLSRRSGYGSDNDSDSDGPQEYYTGGEKSGMLVQDPSKGNPDVDEIFEQARKVATQEPIENLRPSSSSKRSFTGTGRLLSGETVEAAPEPPESVIHGVVFWANGFTVNDGPLRRFDDPENAAFLESIKRSECPKELEPADKRTAVHVSLSRRDEKCPEPVKRFNPFGGVGRTLGAGSSTSSASPEAASASAAAPTSAPPSAAGLYVDESLPSTSIQLRLADGTRMVARFNNHHTVGDIRGFIDASRPGATSSYRLQTVGFPPKQLTDVTQTIEQAGLANSVVIQKL